MPHHHILSDLEHSRKQLVITEIDPSALVKAEKKVLAEASKSLKLKGFRPGNIPENIVREHLDAAYLKAKTLENAIPDVANELIQDQQLRIIGQPLMNIESLDPLKVIIEFDIFPEVSVGEYSEIKVKVEKKVTQDAEVEAALENIKERMTEYREIDRAAQKKDKVEVDFKGFDPDGKPMENAHSKNHPVVLGSNMLIPGFEEALEGMKKGEEKTFPIAFPKDYHAEQLAGKQASFHVSLLKVEEPFSPELDEAFIEKVTGQKQSLEEWKTQIKEQIQVEHDRATERKREESFYDQLISISSVNLPKTLLEQEKKAILNEIKQQIIQRGLSYEKYLEANGKTEEQLLESYDQQASDRLKLRLALEVISEKESIEVTDMDVEERLNELLERYPEEQRKPIKAQYQPGTMAYQAMQYQVKMKKTLEKVLPKE
ncbi:MAG: trigger factor [bacterium]|nr:trigger factor [bacterium]